MDLLDVFLPPYGTLLSGAESQPNHFQNNSLNIPSQLSSIFLDGAGGELQSRFPSLKDIDKPLGYEDVTFEPKTLVPPNWTPETYSTRESVKSFAFVREADARDAVIRYARGQCCQYTDAVKYMKIKEINMLSTFRYTLETFTEKRQVVWCCETCSGESYDLAKNGTPPEPWDIMQKSTKQFEDGTWEAEIPYTASILWCRACGGSGTGKCSTCQGTNEVECTWCNGYGRSSSRECTLCDGKGREICTKCNCAGEVRCCTCDGKRKLKLYIKLITTWTNHKDEFVNQETTLPKELIREESEQLAFQEERTRVRPLDNFPQNSVKEASKRLISEHAKAFPTERILQQRHEVRICPIAQVKYTWKNGAGEFYIHGFKNNVYFPEYPQPDCCSCVVM